MLEYQLQYGVGSAFNIYDDSLTKESGQVYLDNNFEYSKFDVSKISAQIAFGWKYRIVELIIGTRLANVTLNPNNLAISTDNNEFEKVKFVLDNKNTTVIEPFFIGRIG